MWGNNQMVASYADLDALYSSHANGGSASWYAAPIAFVNAPALNFNLVLSAATAPTNASTLTNTTTGATAKLPNLGSFAPQ